MGAGLRMKFLIMFMCGNSFKKWFYFIIISIFGGVAYKFVRELVKPLRRTLLRSDFLIKDGVVP